MAVADSDDEDQEVVVLDLVDDPIVAGPDAVFAAATDEPRGSRRARVIGEEIDGRLDVSTRLRARRSRRA